MSLSEVESVAGISSDVLRVMLDDSSLDPATDPGLGLEASVGLYKAMARTRMLDERLVTLQRQGRIGFHIGSLGEEATIIGSAFAMREQDFIFPCYREFGAALLRGMTLRSYLNNMFGNADDPAKGRQMPDHYTCKSAGFGSVSSPIGTQIIQAVGFSMAARLRGDDVVSLAYFGEGATSSNDFHNGMNFAGVFRAPTVLFCRNNGWAISVPMDRQTASSSFAEKGRAYGVAYTQCDGNDIFAVIRATRDAVLRASKGEGATLIESLTYRMSGHSTSDDPNVYRAVETLEPWRRRDPVERLRRYLVSNGVWDDALQETFENGFDAELKQAIVDAEKTSSPSLESMFEDVYEKMPWHLQEQMQQAKAGKRPPKTH